MILTLLLKTKKPGNMTAIRSGSKRPLVAFVRHKGQPSLEEQAACFVTSVYRLVLWISGDGVNLKRLLCLWNHVTYIQVIATK